MKLINNLDFRGYFGTQEDDLKTSAEYDIKKFITLQNKLSKIDNTPLPQLFFLEQTHSSIIQVIDQNSHLQKPIDIHNIEGDAIITNQKRIGIGVATADCLPLFLYDPETKTIAVIHAGWRGLVAHIIQKTIQQMKISFNCNPKNLIAYLGPCAQVCCYEVQQDFIEKLPPSFSADKTIVTKNGKHFFNNKVGATEELLAGGILEKNMNIEQYQCTICNAGFCSVRTQTAATGRQPSVE